MIIGKDILIVGQQSWDTDIGSNCKNIALEFSKTNRVLYINTPVDRKTLFLNSNDSKIIKRINVINGKEESLVKINDNLWAFYHDTIIESINWINSDWFFQIFNKRNNKKLAKSIDKAIDALNFKIDILFNDGDIFRSFYLKELLNPKLSVYYSRDNFLATDYWKKHGEKYEPLLIAKSDICVANSEYLKDYCYKYNPQSFYVGQGCDLSIFKAINSYNYNLNPLKNIKSPIIGYVGVLSSARLNIALLEAIALKRPDWNLVLVGPEDEIFKNSNLHKQENVYFIGSQKPESLPVYIKIFDVCINPQILNQLTIGNYPRKVDEYLALGKPVVATATKAMETFKNYVFLANSCSEYIEMISKALNSNSIEEQQRRIDFANSHSWENSVKNIYDAIMNQNFGV